MRLKMGRLIDLFVFLLVVISMPSLLFAQSFSGKLSSLGGLMPLIFIFIFFYLFLLRPQQKKTKKHHDLLNSLKKDDRIITGGGLYATVSSVKGNIVEARISDGVNVQIVKQLISAVVTKEDEEASKMTEIVKK
jgi:preprotein translocase subunit YajC